MVLKILPTLKVFGFPYFGSKIFLKAANPCRPITFFDVFFKTISPPMSAPGFCLP